MLKFLLCAIAVITCSYTYVSVPKAYLRDDPIDLGHIESEAFYSEPVNILKNDGNWVYVQMYDDEKGWLKANQITTRETSYPSANLEMVHVNRLKAHVYDQEDTEYGPILTLPFESVLEIAEQPEDQNSRWIKIKGVDGTLGYIQRGDVTLNKKLLNRSEIVSFSKQFLGLPYTWGGRCSFGYDCSGFVQMLYRQIGIDIPRNSKDQLNWDGFKPLALTELEPGDLVFFRSDNGKNSHVGMYIGDGEFIHASPRENTPYIRMSKLFTPPWDGSAEFSEFRAGRTLKQDK